MMEMDLHEHIRRLAEETAENSKRWAVHEAECHGRYTEMRRDLRDMAKMIKWLVVSMIVLCALVIGKGTLPPLETILALVK